MTILIEFAISTLSSQASEIAAFTTGFLCVLILVIQAFHFFKSIFED